MTSPDAETAVVSEQLRRILPDSATGATRRIGIDDDQFLSPRERARLRHAVVARQRASGAARLIARSLLGGNPEPLDIPWTADGAPVWPTGIVGSLAHDESMAAAVVGPGACFTGLGVDLEPADPLDEELTALVASADERRAFGHEPLRGRFLFCIKEAVFKAVNPADGRFLEFDDIAVDRASGMARTRYGRSVRWRLAVGPRILAVAWWWDPSPRGRTTEWPLVSRTTRYLR